jgi:hypothetical protein
MEILLRKRAECITARVTRRRSEIEASRILEHRVIYLLICESRLDDKREMHRDRIGETNRYNERRM